MLHNLSVIWVLIMIVKVSAAADSDSSDAAADPMCAVCDCRSGWVRCRGRQVASLDSLPPSPVTERLELSGCHLPELNVSLLQRLPRLRDLDVLRCGVRSLTGAWRNPRLASVTFAANNFSTFRLRWLDGLPALRTLNLSSNPLRSVSGYPPVEGRLAELDLRGSHWNCTEHGMTWLLRWLEPPRVLHGRRHTRCEEQRKQYRTMDGRRLVEVLRLTEAMLKRCPSEPPFGCSCDLIQVESAAPPPPAPPAELPPPARRRDGPLTAVIVEVYCDNRGLTEFPAQLPDNTTMLYIRNNSLTDFGPVTGNLTGYQALTTLYLDGNLLESDAVNRLEGSDFIHRFSILSLARNQLQTLPLYAFDNAFQKRSFNVDSLFLGGNPWLCDCDSAFTFSFRTWLASQHKLIRDRADIRCGSGPLSDGPPPGPALLALSRSKHCGRVRINWWDLAIGLLATAIAVLMLKFAYDVTVYRRSGELPLVARKLPW